MKIKTDNYVCDICKKKGVKLWRPYMGYEPLVCAECAEERQTSREYEERTWKKVSDGCHVGTPTGKMLPLPKWTVDAEGKVPIYDDPGPEGEPPCMTTQLIVNLGDVSKSYTSGETTLVPACPNENGDFWGYSSAPDEVCKWWKELPTR